MELFSGTHPDGRFLALPAYFRLRMEVVKVTNTLAYYNTNLINEYVEAEAVENKCLKTRVFIFTKNNH